MGPSALRSTIRLPLGLPLGGNRRALASKHMKVWLEVQGEFWPDNRFRLVNRSLAWLHRHG